MKLKEIKTQTGVYSGWFGNWEDFPEAFVVQGGWALTLSASQRGSLVYNIGRIMDDDSMGRFCVFYGVSRRSWVIEDSSNGRAIASKDLYSDVTRPDDFKEAKKWLTNQLDHVKVLGEQLSSQTKLLPEARLTFPSIIAKLPKEIYIKNGVFAEFHEIKPDKATFLLKLLMEDEPLGYLILFRRSGKLWVSTHTSDWRQTGVEPIAATDGYPEEIIRDFVVRRFPLP